MNRYPDATVQGSKHLDEPIQGEAAQVCVAYLGKIGRGKPGQTSGFAVAVEPNRKYFQGKRRIPAPLTLRRHAGVTPLDQLSSKILGLSKMNWNSFDLYSKLPATLQSSVEIARIGSLLQRFGATSYDDRLFI